MCTIGADGGWSAYQVLLPLTGRLRSVRRQFCFCFAVGLMLWVAVYNGYPLVWWDSGAYVQSSFLLDAPPAHPVFYGLFLLVTHWRLTLWGVVVAQSVLVVWLLRAVLENDGRAENAGTTRDLDLVWITACLAIGTSLPWFTGYVMADVFTGVCVLSLFHILLQPLPRRGSLAVDALLVLSLLVHFSHLPLAIALVALVQCCSLAGLRTPRVGAWRTAWSCVGISLLLFPSTNWLLTRRAFFSDATHALVLNRLLSDGTAQKLLSEHCSERRYQLCQYKTDLPLWSGYYLWNPKSPFQRIGGLRGSKAESWQIIRDCMTEYPLLVVQGALRSFFRQLGSFRTGAELTPFLEGTGINNEMQKRFPNEYQRYAQSRQQQGRLAADAFGRLHWWVLVCSAAVSIGIVVRGLWRGSGDTLKLHAFVWAAVVANAAIVGVLTFSVDRYQARLVWLIPFSVLVSLTRQLAARNESRRCRPVHMVQAQTDDMAEVLTGSSR